MIWNKLNAKITRIHGQSFTTLVSFVSCDARSPLHSCSDDFSARSTPFSASPQCPAKQWTPAHRAHRRPFDDRALYRANFHLAFFAFIISWHWRHNETRQPALIFKGRSPTPRFWWVRTQGAMIPNSNSAEIFVQRIYPQVSSFYVYSFESYRIDRHTTNKQTPLKTSNVLRYATTLSNYVYGM